MLALGLDQNPLFVCVLSIYLPSVIAGLTRNLALKEKDSDFRQNDSKR